MPAILLGLAWGTWLARFYRPADLQGWLLAVIGGGALGLAWLSLIGRLRT